jgi:hypothetical protein
MTENTINDLLEFYANLKGDNNNNTVIASKDVEDSFDTIEQIGRIIIDSDEIQKRRRVNIGTIITNAFHRFLPQKSENNKIHLDVDWFARFIDCAQDVSDDEMRLLWAKILSGELNKPNSISAMTLETLRNMSKRDAEIFHKLTSYSLVDNEGGDPFIPSNGMFINEEYKTDEYYGISYNELLWMQELRLINLNAGLQINFNKEVDQSYVETTLSCGKLSIVISSDYDVTIPCYVYTRVGAQLHGLIEDVTPKVEFFEDRVKNRYSSDTTQIDIILNA